MSFKVEYVDISCTDEDQTKIDSRLISIVGVIYYKRLHQRLLHGICLKRRIKVSKTTGIFQIVMVIFSSNEIFK